MSVIKCQQLSDTAQSESSTYQVQGYVKYVSDMPQLYVSDVTFSKLINGFRQHECHRQQPFCRNNLRTYPVEINNATDLVKLLQTSAVEHLTRTRQIEAGDFGSVFPIVTTDFEAMYAYKRGDYQRCLQLSTQNVHTLLYADCVIYIPTLPEFIQLLDDDIVSLTALTLIVNPECRDCYITQLTLSLYLMTQCQLKLRHSMTSLSETLNNIKVAPGRHPPDATLNLLTLKLTAGLILRQCNQHCLNPTLPHIKPNTHGLHPRELSYRRSRRCNCLDNVFLLFLFVYFFIFLFSIWRYLVHISALLMYIHYNSNMGGYCFSGSPPCISLKFDVYVYL